MERRIAVYKQIAYMHDMLRLLHNNLAFYLECRDLDTVRETEAEISQMKYDLVALEAEVCL